MDEIPESSTNSFHDAQIPSAVIPDLSTQSSLDQLLVPIGLPSILSPPPAFDRPIITEKGDSGPREHGNVAASFELGSPENPIIIDLDGEEEYPESESGSAQHPILIEDRDGAPRDDNTDKGSGAGAGPALLYSCAHEASLATISGMQDAQISEPALCLA